ncbi:MAG TPA: protein-disulfide reductase DsbD [Gammaproteobacteria bacterium]|nr:protein-disulfide reductase DsbD [Gammaproteobacteria bacterium]
MTRHSLLFLAVLWTAGTAFAAEPPRPLTSLFGQPERDFLPVEQAFVFDAGLTAEGTVRAHWLIHEGYYLYRDKMRFSVVEGHPAVTLGMPVFPAGENHEDEFFGKQEIYRGELAIEVPLEGAGPFTLKVQYQGCADAGLCYPPVTKTVALVARGTPVTPPASSPPSSVARTAPAGTLSEQDALAQLIRSGHPAWVMLAFLGFGLLLTFTPCVLPMVPILSGIIVGQGAALSMRKAFVLSLTYVLAMALTYTAAGVLAGLTGANLQAAFQNPWVIGVFATVFVLLALAMFGFYELQMPSAVQERLVRLSHSQQGGTLIGVAIMGVLSALIVGPCVAAPLAGALIVIGQAGDPVRGGMALFALSLGMGLPLLAVGTGFGTLLPRAGAWLNAVKAFFGVVLLAVAVWLLERIAPAWLTMLAWALLAIGSAVYLMAPGSGGPGRLWHALGVVLLAWGILIVIGLAAGNRDPLQPLRGIFAGAPPVATQALPFKRIKTIADLERELAAARTQGRPVMLDFYADWCVSCKEMERYTFTAPEVRTALEGGVLLQADVTANDEADRALLAHFGLFGPPSILFFGADGRELPHARIVGYLPADRFAAHVRAAFGTNTLPTENP